MIVNVANMRATKNHALLLRAFAEVRRRHPEDLRLAIVGRDMGMGAELKALAEALRIDREVLFLGLRSDAMDWMAAADLYVSSSDIEGLPLSLLEAGALGRPVVCTQAGGVGEVVEDGVTGRLVTPGNAELLADAMLDVLRSPEIAARLGAAVRERVESEFSLTTMMARYARAYTHLLA
jgi:glycosyltransferase involved in cell wall biosynthesis